MEGTEDIKTVKNLACESNHLFLDFYLSCNFGILSVSVYFLSILKKRKNSYGRSSKCKPMSLNSFFKD